MSHACAESPAGPLLSAGARLLDWLRPFGLDDRSTGLSLWEGEAWERGLRVNESWERRGLASPASGAKHGMAHAACDSPAALRAHSSQAPVVRIPASLLITPAKVRSSSVARTVFGAEVERASDSELLSLFLVHQHRLGSSSKWSCYVSSLPRGYSSVEWWTPSELRDTQSPELELEARRRRAEVRAEWKGIVRRMEGKQGATTVGEEGKEDGGVGDDDSPLPLHWLDSVPAHRCVGVVPCGPCSMCSPPTLAEYQWAWSSVSTRSCFLPQVGGSSSSAPERPATGADGSRNRSCLIPYLDMLNHSSNVSVECALTASSYQLFLRSPSPTSLSPGSELFISYGAHCNRVLLERYGFALLDNAHESVEVELAELERFLTTPQPLLSELEQQSLRAPWPALPCAAVPQSGAGVDEQRAFHLCTCDAKLDVPSVLLRLPRYAQALPGFDRSLAPWQLQLLRACGLYDLAESLEGAAAPLITSSGHKRSKIIRFRLAPCSPPPDLMTYIRVRLLTLEEARSALPPEQRKSTAVPSLPPSRARASRIVGAERTQRVNSDQLSEVEVSAAAAALLNEDAPYLSRAHQLLCERVLTEFFVSILVRDAEGLGRSSTQSDLAEYAAHLSSTPLSYVASQALLLRLTQKRLFCTLIAHLCPPAKQA